MRVSQDLLRSNTDLLDVGVHRECSPNSPLLNELCDGDLISSLGWDASHRETMKEGPHGGAMTTMAYDERRSFHQVVVISEGHKMAVRRGHQVGWIDDAAGGGDRDKLGEGASELGKTRCCLLTDFDGLGWS